MKKMLFFVMLLLTAALVPAFAGAAVPTMSKEELKVHLRSPEMIILDARAEQHWQATQFKIPGAFRTPAEQIDSWCNNFPKDRTIVVYCACSGLGTSGKVASQLIAKGFSHVYALTGGWKDWYGSAYPIEEK